MSLVKRPGWTCVVVSGVPSSLDGAVDAARSTQSEISGCGDPGLLLASSREVAHRGRGRAQCHRTHRRPFAMGSPPPDFLTVAHSRRSKE
jgi:hypothetical protein